jgi:hypothetical protein
MNEQEARERYVARLQQRILATLNEEGLSVPEWESLAEVDRALVAAMYAYEDGTIAKDQLDSKAIGYLNHWRHLHAERTANRRRP